MASLINSTATALTERLITSSDGAQIFAQAVGNPRLPTLVFIHGFALSTLVWASILQNADLLRYFRLIAYDVRGFGRSAMPDTAAGYSAKLSADDFMAVTRAFNTTTKPILVGWSMGGTVASDVTEFYGPDALAGIVYVGAVPFFSARGIVSTPLALRLIPDFMNMDNTALGISTRIEFTNALVNNPERYPADVLWSWLGSTMLTGPMRTMFVGVREQNTTNLYEAGARGVPLLVLDGEADKFILGDEVYGLVEGRFTDLTRHTTRDGSHVFFYEEERQFVRNIVTFARRVFRNA